MVGLPDRVGSLAPRAIQVASLAAPYACAVATVQESELPAFFVCLSFTQMAGTVPVGPYEDHIYLRTEESFRRNWIEVRAVALGLGSALSTLIFLRVVDTALTLAVPFILLAGCMPTLRVQLSRVQAADTTQAFSSSGVELLLKVVFLLVAASVPQKLVEDGPAIGWSLLISTVAFLSLHPAIVRGRSSNLKSHMKPNTGMLRTRNLPSLFAIAVASTAASTLLIFAFDQEMKKFVESGGRPDVAAIVVLLPRLSTVLLFVLRPWLLQSQSKSRLAGHQGRLDVGVLLALGASHFTVRQRPLFSLLELVVVFFFLQIQLARLIREDLVRRAIMTAWVTVSLMALSLLFPSDFSIVRMFTLAGLLGVTVSVVAANFQLNRGG